MPVVSNSAPVEWDLADRLRFSADRLGSDSDRLGSGASRLGSSTGSESTGAASDVGAGSESISAGAPNDTPTQTRHPNCVIKVPQMIGWIADNRKVSELH